MTPLDLMLADFKEKYAAKNPSAAFTRLYDDSELGAMFAYFHEQLTEHFDSINGRARSTRHYWADNSRQLIALADELNQALLTLKASGVDVRFDDRYQQAVDRCLPWLSTSGGSTVPDDFEPVVLVRYEPVFVRTATTTVLKKDRRPVNLKMEGEGSYAIVYSYIDPDYGIKFAVKRAKKGISNRDLIRFKNEFETMKRLSFPYILDVYQYDDTRNEYRMEFCDATLRSFIAQRNNNLSFASRKRIALQFLYAISYLHSQPLLHRDISLQNVLLKVYKSGAVLVKLSDFGLVKDPSSTFTRTQTEMRGTIRDPLLHDFRQYGVLNEIYSIGWVLSYIFTGRESLSATGDAVSRIVQKCAAHDITSRYQAVRDLIADVEQLSALSADTSA
ncbi:protein kinase family protein [Microtetraspora sp. AC03309]|uniref:protein kinase family protein n=1 Tax=Microtetraspora sp. AC03309 TaxID=2779376 RepID=UPI001E298A2B|nr:protein kinase family protein [Microtetraspora sp. AC03309]MCC5577246.1 protein kinase family protein [Microtetraspora sp. AC03309]